jgi:hypothetical protein
MQTSNSWIRPSPYGFVGSVLEAFSKHQNLLIRPDDIWINILGQFSVYVNARAEELRDIFVDFEGQKQLEIRVDGTMRTFLRLAHFSALVLGPDCREY